MPGTVPLLAPMQEGRPPVHNFSLGYDEHLVLPYWDPNIRTCLASLDIHITDETIENVSYLNDCGEQVVRASLIGMLRKVSPLIDELDWISMAPDASLLFDRPMENLMRPIIIPSPVPMVYWMLGTTEGGGTRYWLGTGGQQLGVFRGRHLELTYDSVNQMDVEVPYKSPQGVEIPKMQVVDAQQRLKFTEGEVFFPIEDSVLSARFARPRIIMDTIADILQDKLGPEEYDQFVFFMNKLCVLQPKEYLWFSRFTRVVAGCALVFPSEDVTPTCILTIPHNDCP